VQQIFRGIGVFSVRFRWVIVVAWVVITLACVRLFPGLSTVAQSGNNAFLPADSPSSKAIQLAAPFQNTRYASLTLIAARTTGPLTAVDQATVDQVEGWLRTQPHVKVVLDTGVSRDGAARQAAIQADVRQMGGGTADQLVSTIRTHLRSVGASSGLQLHLTGQLALSVDNTASLQTSQGNTTSFTVLFIIAFLLLVFRAPLAPLITLIPAGLVVLLAGPVITGAANHLHLTVSTITPLLLIVLLLGAGTDYALFLIYRVREELRNGLTPPDAVRKAVSTVGETITFSAFTVMAALLSLVVAQFGIYQSLGPSLAIGIFLMLLAGLTLLPALLAIFGRAVFWPTSTRRVDVQPVGMWGRITAGLVQRPALTLMLGVLLFGGLALGTLNSPTAGLGAVNVGPPGADSTLGSDLIAKHYPAPGGILTQVFFEYGQPIWQSPAPLGIAQQQLGAISAVKLVLGPLTPNGFPLTVAQLTQLHQALGTPQTLPIEEPTQFQGTVPLPLYNAYRGTAQYISSDGRTILFVTLLKENSGGTAAVPALRHAVTLAAQAAGAAQSGIFGTDELAYDVGQVTTSDLGHIIPLVAVLIALLLALVLRSLIAPLYLVVSVVFSYLAALGLVSIVFVHLGGQDGIQFVLPFLMFVFLMALGSDYNILVMTRIREEAHSKPLREAVRHAVSITGTTVTTAGLILAGTFAVLGFAAGGSQNAAQIQQIGFGIAAGVLMDTFLVRTLLVPTMVILLGRWNWWPSPLFRQAASLRPGNGAVNPAVAARGDPTPMGATPDHV
jgi:RND superfamily putative drug exporter